MPNDVIASLSAQIDANTVKLRSEMDRAATETRRAMGEIKGSVQEAKAAIGLLGEEIGVHLDRHLRGFLAQLPGVAKIMSAAFSGAAVIGLGLAVFETGKKIYEYMEKAKKAGEEAAKATRQATEAGRMSNIELDLSNDKLAMQISKLEHRPVNALKLALDEARKSAEELGSKLEADMDKANELIENQSAGWFKRTFLGHESSEPAVQQAKSYKEGLDLINDQYRAKASMAKDEKESQKIEVEHMERLAEYQNQSLKRINDEYDARKRLQDLRSKINPLIGVKSLSLNEEAEYKGLNSQFATGRDLGFVGDQSGLLRGLAALKTYVGNEAGSSTGTALHMRQQSAADQLTANEENAKAAKEQQRKADEAQMKAFEQDLASLREQHRVGVEEEHAFWIRKLDATRLGSANFNAILIKLGQENQEILKQNAEAIKKQSEIEAAISREDDARIDREMRAKQDLIRKHLALAEEQQKGAREGAGESYQATSEATAAGVATGAISPAARNDVLRRALQVEQSAKQKSFDEDIRTQQAALDSYKHIYGEQSSEYQILLEDGNKHLQSTLDERNKMQADADKQMAALQRETMETGWQGAVNDMQRRAMDLQGQLKELIEGATNSANDTISRMMTGEYKKGDWSKTAKGILGGASKTALQDAEGFGLKALNLGGGGKIGSTQGNAMWVRLSEGGTYGLKGGLSSIFPRSQPNVTGPDGQQAGAATGMVTKGLLGWLNNSNWASSLGGGNLFGSGGMLAGGLADGGNFSPGNYMVGEKGPEIMSIGSSGFMHNADKTRTMVSGGVGGGDIHYHIDARGTDPALTQHNVMRGMRQTHQQSVKDSAHVISEHAKRVPQR